MDEEPPIKAWICDAVTRESLDCDHASNRSADVSVREIKRQMGVVRIVSHGSTMAHSLVAVFRANTLLARSCTQRRRICSFAGTQLRWTSRTVSLSCDMDGHGSIMRIRLRRMNEVDGWNDTEVPNFKGASVVRATLSRCSQTTHAGSWSVHDTNGKPITET